MFKIAVHGEALYIDRNNLYVSSKGIIIKLHYSFKFYSARLVAFRK